MACVLKMSRKMMESSAVPAMLMLQGGLKLPFRLYIYQIGYCADDSNASGGLGRREIPVFPFIDTAPRAARPVIVLGLIAANTIVFLWMWSLLPRALNQVLVHAALIPIRYTEPLLARRY